MTEYGQREPAGGAASVRCPHRKALTGLASQHGASVIAAQCTRNRFKPSRAVRQGALLREEPLADSPTTQSKGKNEDGKNISIQRVV